VTKITTVAPSTNRALSHDWLSHLQPTSSHCPVSGVVSFWKSMVSKVVMFDGRRERKCGSKNRNESGELIEDRL